MQAAGLPGSTAVIAKRNKKSFLPEWIKAFLGLALQPDDKHLHAASLGVQALGSSSSIT